VTLAWDKPCLVLIRSNWTFLAAADVWNELATSRKRKDSNSGLLFFPSMTFDSTLHMFLSSVSLAMQADCEAFSVHIAVAAGKRHQLSHRS
jgi:hypothetical protein